jgi:branched-chain amino acid transport system substrate-binding protein
VSIRMRAVAVGLCLPFFVAACGSGSDDSTAPQSSSGGASAPAPADANSALDDKNAWALGYTGGKAGAASGTPYKIGYVNDDSFLPATTIGMRAAVDYINAELGGVGGRPIDLVSCATTSAEDAAKCGTQFANDKDISTVVVGSLDTGNKELYDAIGGKKAILIGNPLSSVDFVTPAAVSYTSGSPGALMGMARFAVGDLKGKTVAVIIPDTPSGRAAVAQLLTPIFNAAGATLKSVFVSATATTPEMSTALQATGAAKADVLVTPIPPNLCISLYDAMKSINATPKVVTTDQCAGTEVQDHLKSLGEKSIIPDGWYFANFGYNYNLPDVDSGMATYKLKSAKYAKALGSAKVDLAGGFAPVGFAAAMSAVKIINQVGVDAATFQTVDAALRSFAGPAMMQVGPLKCGVPPFVAVCGHQMGIGQYTGNKWVSVRDGLNKNPIDLLSAS